MNRLVTSTFAARSPGATGEPAASTGSTITRSSARWPNPAAQVVDGIPASVVPHQFQIGTCQACATSARISGNSGSPEQTTSRGAIPSRPAAASRASERRAVGYPPKASGCAALSVATISAIGQVTGATVIGNSGGANVRE
ncbi:MAG: hypothetical protein ACT4QG_10080 [Sporichthyaceae bacterium]